MTTTTSLSPFGASVLLRPHNFQWYWNSTADPQSVEEHRQIHADVENEILGDAYSGKKSQVEIDGGFIIYRKGDEKKSNPI